MPPKTNAGSSKADAKSKAKKAEELTFGLVSFAMSCYGIEPQEWGLELEYLQFIVYFIVALLFVA